MEGLFLFLYPIVPMAALFGFIPQIYNLSGLKAEPQSISMQSWSIWTMTWVVSLGYGIFVLKDFMFTFSAALNFACSITIVTLVIYKRFKYKPVAVVPACSEV